MPAAKKLFHVNDAGEVGECSAKVQACPFAANRHFPTRAEATAFAEQINGVGADMFSSKMSSATDLKKIEIQNLITELTDAANKYYQEFEESPLSDEEFDAKQAYVNTFVNVYPDLFAAGTPGAALLDDEDVSMGTEVAKGKATVVREFPMLSLAKAKSAEEVKKYLEKMRKSGATGFRLQAKLDGFAMSAEYENGKVVRLSTRGNGFAGEDISYLLTNSDVTIEGLPTDIADKNKVEARGELILSDGQFADVDKARQEAHSTDAFKNSRNAVVGIVKKAKKGLGYKVTMTFCNYSIVENNKLANRDTLKNQGFITVDDLTKQKVGQNCDLDNFKSDDDVMKNIDKFGVLRENFDIPTDGIVIKPENEAEMQEKMGSTAHHPSSQLAFKYPAPTVVTTVKDIITTVGKTGKLTLVAEVEPVDILGSTVSRATLNNHNWAINKGVRVGSTVNITKANDIIPFVKNVISNPPGSQAITVPTACPSCGKPLWYDKTKNEYPPQTLLCRNHTCPSRQAFALKGAVRKDVLDIDGLSSSTLDSLHSSGRVIDIADLYTLTQEELANSKSEKGVRFGEKRAAHVLEYIEKSKSLPLNHQLKALNIASLGNTTGKLLMKKFGDIDSILNAKVEDIAAIDGLGDKTATEIVEGLERNRELIVKLRKHGLFAAPAPAAAKSADNGDSGDSDAIDLSGLSFSISGAVPAPFSNRNQWADYVEANGGEYHATPKATTSYMVGDSSESSAKIKKANSLGLKFLTPEQFTSQFTK